MVERLQPRLRLEFPRNVDRDFLLYAVRKLGNENRDLPQVSFPAAFGK